MYINGNNGGGNNNNTREEGKSDSERYAQFIKPQELPKLEKEITSDLATVDYIKMKPLSSSYSLPLPCALNLIANRDYSAEESRWQYHQARQNNTLNAYELEMNARDKDIRKCMDRIKARPDWAARYLQKNTQELTEHGRLAMAKEFIDFPLDLTGASYANNSTATQGTPSNLFGGNPFAPATSSTSTASPFASTSTPSSTFGSPFGQTGAGPGTTNTGSAFGANPFSQNNATQPAGGAFGKPAFGATPTSTNTGTPFGGSSAFGKPAFGTAPAAGATNSSPFGAAGSSSAFGKPAFGATPQSTNTTSAFGTATQTTGSPFGSMSQTAGTSSAFGNPAFGTGSTASQPATASAFGSTAFGTPGFGSIPAAGAAAQPAMTTSGSFGSSAFGTSGFGNIGNGAAKNSPFGTLSGTTATSAFGNTTNNTTVNDKSPFGLPATGQNASPFGLPTTNTKESSAFGSANTQSSQASPFGAPLNTQPNGLFGQATSNMKQTGQSDGATNNNENRRFIQGISSENDTVVKEEDLLPTVLEQFKAVKFSLGKVPDVPPPLSLIA